jgi:uncharacterized protein (DUF433 family)
MNLEDCFCAAHFAACWQRPSPFFRAFRQRGKTDFQRSANSQDHAAASSRTHAALACKEYEIIVAGGHQVTNIDWSECPLVEIKPGVQSGAPVLLGTRMPADAIVDNFDYGLTIAEIAEQFQIPPEHIEAILTYASSHRRDRVPTPRPPALL